MDAATTHDLFFHVRVFVGIVTELSVARLLAGLAKFVQHPGQYKIYPVHFGWVIFLILAVVHFWWFEFGLSRIGLWTFDVYFFVICYAALFYFICVILFPDSLEEYSGYADYFHSRQRWFFGLLAALFVVDLIDTALKGADHFKALGAFYPARQAVFCALAVLAIFVKDLRFHQIFVVLCLIAQVVWIVTQFEVLR
jgi:hypothetical protein